MRDLKARLMRALLFYSVIASEARQSKTPYVHATVHVGSRTHGRVTLLLQPKRVTKTKFAGSKFEQPLSGWPKGQNTGRVL